MSKALSIFILSAVVLTAAVPVFAQVDKLTFSDVRTILTRLATWMFYVLLILAVIMIIIAAYKYLTAGGDESKVSSAHKTLIYALIAIGIGLLSRGLVFLVGELLRSPIPAF